MADAFDEPNEPTDEAVAAQSDNNGDNERNDVHTEYDVAPREETGKQGDTNNEGDKSNHTGDNNDPSNDDNTNDHDDDVSDSDGDDDYHADDDSFAAHSSRTHSTRREAPAQTSTPPPKRAPKHDIEHTPAAEPKRRRNTAEEDSDEAVEEALLGEAPQHSLPQVDDYLPIPFPHKTSETEKPDIPDARSKTVLEWIKEQQDYLLSTMRERISARISGMRQRNAEQRARLEKKLRSM